MTMSDLADDHQVSIDLVRSRCQINQIGLIKPTEVS
jgi:hypothetical protein